MKVTLQKPHTHAGEQKKPGDKIEVDTETAQWLADQGVIALPAPADTPKPAQEK